MAFFLQWGFLLATSHTLLVLEGLVGFVLIVHTKPLETHFDEHCTNKI